MLKYKSRIKSLVIPYLFWTIYSCLLYLFLQSIPFIGVFFTKGHVINYSFSEWVREIFISPSIAFQFWFVQDLIIIVLITPLLFQMIKYFNYYLILLFIIAWFSNLSFYIFQTQSILFFSIGALLSIKNVELTNFKLKKYNLLFFFTWLSTVFINRILVYNEIKINLNFINSILKISIFFGIISIWFTYDKIVKDSDISKAKIFNFFSYSFFLFAFHEPFGTLLEYGLYFILGKNQLSSLIIYVISPVIIIMTSILIAKLLQKRTPKFYYLLTGGR